MIRHLCPWLLSRWTIASLHVLVIYVLGSALLSSELRVLLFTPHSADSHEGIEKAVEVLEGLSIILIGYGVALEEREFLRGKAGLLQSGEVLRESQIDESCYATGVYLLMLGLFAEIAVKLVELPDHIVNTVSIEVAVLTLAMGLQLLALALLARHWFKLLFEHKEQL